MLAFVTRRTAHTAQVWEKASIRFQSQHEAAICDGLSTILALVADAREKTGDLSGAERLMDQALNQSKKSRSAHAAKCLPSLYSNLARIQLASGDTVSASTTLKVCCSFLCQYDGGRGDCDALSTFMMKMFVRILTFALAARV